MGIQVKYIYTYCLWNPPLELYAALHASGSDCMIEAQENYQKRSWRNRALIMGPQGLMRMSLPLEKGKNHQMPIREVKLAAGDDWKVEHLKTIQTNYQSAPYFEHYFPFIEELYARNDDSLWSWNEAWSAFWLRTLGFSAQRQYTLDFRCGTAPAGIPIWDKEVLREIGNYHSSDFWYPQVFEYKHGFQREVSIMDALFCAGPETRSYLNTYYDESFSFSSLEKTMK